MSLISFTYNDTPVRVVDCDGEPWWIAVDVAAPLGLANIRSSVALLDADERGVHTVDTPSGAQKMTIVSEAGLYSLILRSRKPEAKAFKRWVTHEVLPSIRKRGGYLTPEATEAALTDPDFIIRLATELKTERAARAQLEAQAEADRPKVLFADSVSASRSTILVGEVAKILKGNGVNIGGTRLFEVLRRRGLLISREGSDKNMPTQRAMELGLFQIKETSVVHSDGHTTVSKTPKVTGKGQQYIVERVLSGAWDDTLDQVNAAKEVAA